MSNLQNWANIAQIAQAILVVISFLFVGYQLHQSIRLAKAANMQHLTEQAANFNGILYQNAKLASLWYSFGKNLSDRPIEEQLQYREMLVQWMIFHENIFYQWKRQLLDDEIYYSWRTDFINTVQKHNLSSISSNIVDTFTGEFGREIERVRRGNVL